MHRQPDPAYPYDRAVLSLEKAAAEGRLSVAAVRALLVEVPCSIYGRNVVMGSSRKPSLADLQRVLASSMHVRDGDCTVGTDGCCTGCGVSHTALCECGGRGFHRDGCKDSEAPAKNMTQPST